MSKNVVRNLNRRITLKRVVPPLLKARPSSTLTMHTLRSAKKLAERISDVKLNYRRRRYLLSNQLKWPAFRKTREAKGETRRLRRNDDDN